MVSCAMTASSAGVQYRGVKEKSGGFTSVYLGKVSSLEETGTDLEYVEGESLKSL